MRNNLSADLQWEIVQIFPIFAEIVSISFIDSNPHELQSIIEFEKWNILFPEPKQYRLLKQQIHIIECKNNTIKCTVFNFALLELGWGEIPKLTEVCFPPFGAS